MVFATRSQDPAVRFSNHMRSDRVPDKTNINFAGLINAQDADDSVVIEPVWPPSCVPIGKMNQGKRGGPEQPDPRDDVSAPILPF